jgi:carboxypeptidase C (cathepsin A)
MVKLPRPIALVFPVLLALCASGLLPSGIGAQEEPEKQEEKPIPEPVRFESTHSGTFNGESIQYRAVVADVQLKRDDGKAYASVFTTSYLREDAGASDPRPVTFVFNGGPGSASVWLHMGLVGPRRVDVPSDAEHAGSPPYAVADNPLSPLDVTDVVLIDPPGTGFSRLVGDGKAEDVWGLREDARTVANVVREWVRQNDRWNSPIYLAGESFGTTRAAAMLPELMRGSEPIAVKGVILISQAMDYTGSSPYVDDNLIAFVTYLPTLAATAWYHGKVDRAGRTLESFLEEVREFAIEDYLPALFKGSSLGDAEEQEIARRYAGYIGLDVDYVLRSRLRVNSNRFVKELLRDEGLAIGRLDGRYTAAEVDDISERPSFDAASAAISAPYTSALHQHLTTFLGVDLDRPYHTSGPDVGRGWVWDRSLSSGGEPRYVNTAPDLAWALSYNPDLTVLVACGYYDYATPFFDAEYTMVRHGIDMNRVTMTYYEAGHMMYLHDPSREAVAGDIRDFILGG